jgi:hypothetical protein
MISAVLMSAALIAAGPDAPDVRKEYETARAQAGRDPEAHVKLALWCEAHGLEAERLKHLALVVMADPSHALARSLMGLVEYRGKWARPDQVSDRVHHDAELAEKLAEYNARRSRLKNTADAHWKLALWCEEQGLKAEATAHLTSVVRLDPGREVAWKRLGCKKFNGRWLTEAQIQAIKAERAAQAKANETWLNLLTRWKADRDDRDPKSREASQAGLAGIRDPRVVPAAMRVFGTENPTDQIQLIRILGQVDAPAASRGLALISLCGLTPEIRRSATETLARCDPHDYMAPLIALLRQRLRYEVRPVGGPGSPGALYVEGQQFNRMRYYAPPAPDFLYVGNGQSWATDDWGFEILRVPGPDFLEQGSPVNVATFTGAEYRHGVSANDPRGAALGAAISSGSTPWKVATGLFKPGWGTADFIKDSDFNVNVMSQTNTTRSSEVTVPIGRILAEYRLSAAVAQEQLKQDVALVENENLRIDQANNLVVGVLNNVSGQNLPADPEAWRAWWTDQLGYTYTPPGPVMRPTVVENVPLAYLPQSVPSVTRVGPVTKTETQHYAYGQMTSGGLQRMAKMGIFQCCFAAGTLVRTLDGTKPIESLHVGDLVLSLDTTTGGLRYQPVLTVFQFRPTATIRLALDAGGALTCTPLHRFWKSGEGWTMARDLKPGDVLRTLGGTSTVTAIDPQSIGPVYNLEVAGDADFFVGDADVLTHDNTPVGRRSEAFDAVETLAKAR